MILRKKKFLQDVLVAIPVVVTKAPYYNGGSGESGNCPNSFDRDCLRKEFLDNWSQGQQGSLNLITEVSQIVKQYIALVRRWCKAGKIVKNVGRVTVSSQLPQFTAI